MSNISQISKASRLTEKDVHEAAEELKESGIRPSSIEVYKFLGRGSLTTITNFLKTWNQEETHATALPALISLPEALIKSTEQLIVKVWAESQALAEKEISSQREALRQAEALANEKIAEAKAFSEVQAREIEALNNQIEKIYKDWEADHADMLKGIETEQDARQQSYTEKAISEQKLREIEKQFDYVNSVLIKQQETNQALTAENIELKTKLEAAEKTNQKAEEKIKQLEKLVIENKRFEIKAGNQEAEINQLKLRLASEEKRSEKNLIDCEKLREKAAMLEGELLAWKTIKTEEKPATTKNQKGKQFGS